MGIRRRRRKLTTTISSMESRIKRTELRPISLLTTDQINAAVTIGAASTPDNFFVGSSAPNTYNIIQDAYYYPKKLTGKDKDLVEIYTQGSLSLSVDKRIEISGIHGTVDTIVDVTSDNFSVVELEESPWTGRASYKHNPTQDQLPGVVIGYSYSVAPESLGPSSWTEYQRLETRAVVESFQISDTTVTITTPSAHRFQVNDVIYVNLNADGGFHNESNIAFGQDGFFKVTATTSNTISYVLSLGVDGTTDTIEPTATNIYVFATARNWCAVGDTWINTSTTPDTTYYWNGLRWAEFTAASTGAGADSLAPGVVSNVAVVSAESGGYTDSSGTPRSRITLTWEAPTQNSDGSELNDLAGYEVWYSYINGSEWIKSGVLSTETKYTATNLDPAKTIFFKIYAVDSSLNRSTAVDFSEVSGTFASVLNPPSEPILASDLGVVTARWNGLDNTGVNPHPSIRLIETHVSTQDNFTTSETTRVASMTASTDNYSSIYQYNDGTGTLVNMAYETDYYFKFVAVDASGNKTSGSAQGIARISQVDGAAIQAGAISAKILTGETITATSPSSPFQIELNANHLRAVNKTSGVETFKMDTATGTVRIGTGITNTTINGNLISVQNISANNITSGIINANVIGVTNLNASNITFGTLNGSNVSVQNLNASSITAGTFSGDRISGGTITGTTISGGSLITSGTRRVQISGSEATFYDGSGTLSGRVTAGEDGRAATMYFGTGVSGVFAYNGGVDIEANGAVNLVNGGGMTSVGEIESTTGFYTPGYIDIGTARMTQNAGGQIEAPGFRATGNINVAGQFNYAAPTGTGTALQIQVNNLVVKSSSSRRYKDQIENAVIDTAAFISAPIRQFKYHADIERFGVDDAPLLYGYIAEELHDLGLRDLLIYDEDGQPDAVQFNSVMAALHKIIQIQEDRINLLEERVAALENKG